MLFILVVVPIFLVLLVVIQLIVCVTDRGPRSRKRLIDLSEEAAERLDFKRHGVTKVRIEEVPGPLDLRYLDLIYPHIPYLDLDYLQPEIPYRFQ